MGLKVLTLPLTFSDATLVAGTVFSLTVKLGSLARCWELREPLGSTEQWALGGLTVPPAEGSREAAGKAVGPVLVSCCSRAQKMAGVLGPWGG